MQSNLIVTGRSNIIITIMGKKGQGKTFFNATKILPIFNRLIIFDSQNEHKIVEQNILERMKNNNHQVNVFNSQDCIDFYLEFFELTEFKIVFKTSKLKEIESVLNVILHVGKVTVNIEEIHLFQVTGMKKDLLYELFTTGRHNYINVIGTAQRFSTVTRTNTGQSDILISFKQTEDTDIKFAMKHHNDAGKLRYLEVGEFMVLDGLEKFVELFRGDSEIFTIDGQQHIFKYIPTGLQSV